MTSKFKIALCQFSSGEDREANLARAESMIQQAVSLQAQVVVLPECFNSPYSIAHFANYSETIDPASPSVAAMSRWATTYNIYLIGGSIPERSSDNIYNTCVCFGPDGSIQATHRKVHLFDINVPGGITFYESEVLSGGERLTRMDTPFTRIGLGICYDVRFGEYACALARPEEVGLLVYPGNFNMTTGPKHWELLLRARAVDNQVFVAGCSQARDEGAGYVSWGHSLLVNPWGEVVAKLDEKEGVLVHEIDLAVMQAARSGIWVRKQKKPEVYAENT